MNEMDIIILLNELRSFPNETEWIEFNPDYALGKQVINYGV